MKIWEAIIYAIVGGLTELLPISFSGHSLMLQNVFHFSPLYSGDGLFVRAGISLGIFIALYMVFHQETKESLILMGNPQSRDPRHRRARREEQEIKTRMFLLTVIGLIPMLFSFFFMKRAEGIGKLSYVSVFFVINGLLILFCTRGSVGKRGALDANIFDGIWIGLFRMLSVFPGLSSFGSSLCIGRARGLNDSVNLQLTYKITLAFELLSVVYYLILGIAVGDFYGRTILSFVVAVIVSAPISLLALVTFKNVIAKNKLRSFMYYCFDAAAISFIIAIING